MKKAIATLLAAGVIALSGCATTEFVANKESDAIRIKHIYQTRFCTRKLTEITAAIDQAKAEGNEAEVQRQIALGRSLIEYKEKVVDGEYYSRLPIALQSEQNEALRDIASKLPL